MSQRNVTGKGARRIIYQIVRQSPGMCISQIAYLSGYTPRTVYTVLLGLESDGLVQRDLRAAGQRHKVVAV